MFFIRPEEGSDSNSNKKMTALDLKKYILKVCLCLQEREKNIVTHNVPEL